MPVIFGDGFGGTAGDDAGVVEQDVDAAVFGKGSLDDAGAGFRVGVVRLDELADASRSLDLRNNYPRHDPACVP